MVIKPYEVFTDNLDASICKTENGSPLLFFFFFYFLTLTCRGASELTSDHRKDKFKTETRLQ